MAVGVYVFGFLPMARSSSQLSLARDESRFLALNVDQKRQHSRALEFRIERENRLLAERYHLRTNPGQPIIEILSQLMLSHQLDLVNLRESKNPTNTGIRVDLQVEGGYQAMMRFLYDLGQLDMPACVTTMRMLPSSAASQAYSGTFQLEMFPSQLVRNIESGARYEQSRKKNG